MNTIYLNPYVGPRTFRKEEGHLFFGREREEGDLLALVITEQLVLFYAQSGTGKSSIINTRLIPALENKGFEVLPVGRVSGADLPLDIEIDNIYVHTLMHSLVKSETDENIPAKLSLTEFLTSLDRDEMGYYYHDSPLPSISESVAYTPWKRALIIDQFEELFTTHLEAWDRRDDFFRQLAQAMHDDPYLWVVLVMREDFIAYLDPYAHLLPNGLSVRYYMQRLERDAALRAIQGPASKKHRPYAEGVAEELVDDLSRSQIIKSDGELGFFLGQYVEPIVLQAVCYRLWEKLEKLRPEGLEITNDDFHEAMVDVTQALGDFYAERVKAVAEGEVVRKRGIKEYTIREWFERELITADGTRDKVAQEFGRKSGGLDDDIVQEFVRRGDLVRAEKSGGGATFYELTHDRLVPSIIANNKEWEVKNSSYFRPQSKTWQEGGNRKIDLLSGEALVEAEQWAVENPDNLTTLEVKFLEESREYQDFIEREEKRQHEEQQQKLDAARERAQEQARAARIARMLTGIAAIAFAIAAIGAGIAIRRSNEAVQSAATAVAAQTDAVSAQLIAEAAQATAVTSADYSRANELAELALESSFSIDQSILLSVAAYNKSPTNPRSQRALAQIFQQNAPRIQRLERILEPVNPAKDVEISPDGQILAIRGDNEITIWKLADNERESYPITDSTLKMYFSPDSRFLAAVDRAGIHWWDLSNNSIQPLLRDPINLHTGELSKLIVHHDRKAVISVGEDQSILRWELGTYEKSLIPVQSENITVSPSGDTLAAVEEDDQITLWNTGNGEKILGPFQGEKLTFSPGGEYIATVNFERTVTIRKAETGEVLLDDEIVPGLAGKIDRMVFSRIGDEGEGYLAIYDAAQTILWDIKKDEQIGDALSGTPRAFSPNGNVLIVDSDGYIQPYCILSKQLGRPIYRRFVDFSSDGKTFVTYSYYDGITPSFWSISENYCEWVLNKVQTFRARSVLFSPKEGMLASLELNGAIWLRNAANGARVGVPIYQPKEAETSGNLYFSPTGGLLAYFVENRLYVWNLEDNRQKIDAPEGMLATPITALLFASDDLLVAAHKNGDLTIWNVLTNEVKELPSGTRGKITNLLFNPNSTKEALSISRNSVFLVDAASGKVLSGPMDGQFLDVQWEKNRLATAQADKIILWNIRTGERIGDPIEGRTANFSPDGKYLLIGRGFEFILYLYDADVLDPIGEPFRFSLAQKYDVRFSPNGERFALAAKGARVNVFRIGVDPENDNAQRIIFTHVSSSSCYYGEAMEFSPDSAILYFQNSTFNYICTLDLSSVSTSENRVLVGGGAITPIHWDGANLILGNINPKGATSRSLASVTLWDTDNFIVSRSVKSIETINLGLDQNLNLLDFRIDREGKRLVTLGEDGNISLWNIARDIEPLDIAGIIAVAEDSVPAAAVSPDGLQYAKFIKDGIVIGNAETSNRANDSQPFNEHILQVKEVFFSSDNQILAVMGEDGQTVFYGPEDNDGYKRIGEQVDAAFVPKSAGEKIWVTTSSDDSKTIWDSNTGNAIRELSNKESLVGYSANGRYIAVRDSTGDTTLWNISGNRIGDSISENFKAFNSGNTDTTYFVLQDAQANATVWEISSTDIVSRVGAIPGIFSAISPDGKYIVMNDLAGNITLWNSVEGKSIRTRRGVFIAFSPNSELIAYKTGDQIFLLNAGTGTPFGQPIRGDMAAFSPDGLILASRDFSSTIAFLLDTTTGRPIGRSFEGEFKFVSPDGQTLVTTDYSQGLPTSRLWGRLKGDQLWDEIEFAELIGFSPDGKILIERKPDGTITLLNAADPSISAGIIDAKVVFSADYGLALALNLEQNEFALWDIEGDSPPIRDTNFSDLDANSIESAAFSPDGKILALFGSGGVVLWDIDNGRQIGVAALQEKSGIVTKLLFSPQEQYLASLGSDGLIIWSLKPSPAFKKKISLDGNIIDMSFSKDESVITYLSDEFGVIEYNIETDISTPWPKSPIPNPKAVCDYTLSPDGTKLAYRVFEKIFIWGKNILTPISNEEKITTTCMLGALAFHPDQEILAIGNGDRILLWDWNSAASDKRALNGKGVFTAASLIVFVDGQYLAVQDAAPQGGQYSKISLWSLTSNSKIDEITAGNLVNLASNGSKLLYQDSNERVLLQDLSPELQRFEDMRERLCKLVARDFFPEEWNQFFPNEIQKPVCAAPTR